MSQRIQQYGGSPFAEEALRMSEVAQGQPGMSRTSAPVGPNLADGGGMSKPNVNAQPFNNQRLEQQSMVQNVQTAVPGAQANALGQVRKQVAELSGAEKAADDFKTERVSQMLYANDGGTATFGLAMPEVAARIQQSAAQQKLISDGIPGDPRSNHFAA